MGHKGDIEARYSTNKRLPPNIVDDMRASYQKCTQFLETRVSEGKGNEVKEFFRQQVLIALGYGEKYINEMNLAEMSNEEFQEMIKNKITTAMTGNGHKQKVIPVISVAEYIERGFEFVANLGNGTAVVKLPF